MVRVSGNTWMPIGVGGNFMPGASQGTSSAEYYKCTDVTTVSAAPQGATLTMHQGSAQWVFHLQNASATGDNRVWVSQA